MTLIAFVNIKSVYITCVGQVTKSNDLIVSFNYIRDVGMKRLIPDFFLFSYFIEWSLGHYLFSRIISCIDRMYCLKKQSKDLINICAAIFSNVHIFTP